MNNINALEVLQRATAQVIHQSTDDRDEAERIITKGLPSQILRLYHDIRVRESTRLTAQSSFRRDNPMDEQKLRNLRHWAALFRTDPAQTKDFTRTGGFSGTGIKPTFLYFQLTAYFGPEGIGWGHGKPEWTFRAEGGNTFVICDVECWYKDEEEGRISIWGTGGDLLMKKGPNETVFHDDEASKKALTDAIGNGFTRLGAGQDIRMGLHKNSKYLDKINQVFREVDPDLLPPAETREATSQKPNSYSRPTLRRASEVSPAPLPPPKKEDE